MVAHLPNIDLKLAERVAKGLGMDGKLKSAKAAVEPRDDMKKSKALSIMLNPPGTFAGRKVGALVTNGSDHKLIEALKTEIQRTGATLELVAPTIEGIHADDGSALKVDHKIGGGPSVLFDAVVILPSAEGVQALATNAAASEFVADAFGHLKYIGWVATARPLFERAGILEKMDAGCIELNKPAAVRDFVSSCENLRLWDRERVVTF